MDIRVLGIDLGETVCSLAGLDEAGAVVCRKRLQRHRLLDFLATFLSTYLLTSTWALFALRRQMSGQ